MTNNGKWMIVTGFAVVILVLVAVLVKTADQPAPFHDLANEHENNGRWELARAAWFTAKDRVGNPSARGDLGRIAYYEYRIGMTYEREGQHVLAIAHVQNALRTPASEIDSFMGRNGTKGMREDLDDLVAREAQDGITTQ